MRLTDELIDKAIDNLPILKEYSLYSKQIRPFIETFGAENVQLVFFDSLTKNSQRELERVCSFIGYTEKPTWQFDLPEQNVSAERVRVSPLRDKIVYSPLVTAIRKTLIPKGVRDKVRNLWSMKDRPTLSEANIAKLTALFDQDLAQLGAWLGVELTCANFKEVAKKHVPGWVNPPSRVTSE
jgi:hypothetical protein